MNVTALVALLIVVGLAILGYARGLITSVWHLAGAIIVIALTIMLAPTVAEILNNNEKIHSKVYEKVEQTINIQVPEGGFFDLDKVVDDMNLPEGVAKMFKDSVSDYNDSLEAKEKDMVTSFYEKATRSVITGISYIITLILVIILCAIGVWLLNKFFELPGLNAVNKVGGLIFGLLEGIVIVWAACGIITVFAATEFGSTVIAQIQENPILHYFYDHNLVSTVISAKMMLSK